MSIKGPDLNSEKNLSFIGHHLRTTKPSNDISIEMVN